MDQDIKYWKQGEHLQNFGDFLSQYFLQHLFYAQPTRGQVLHVIGSCIDDMFVPSDTAEPRIFWGCGLRTPNGLSEDRFARAEILAVRGPLTRSALRLGETVPIGDPGLLLPALHKAARLNPPTGRALLVPHFHEKRSDLELQALTGCDDVLRPNIQNDLGAIDDFIERLVAADFVLTGSLHAAITAAAYGSRFGFWDSGDIDLPFKWEDFAASINIPCAFHVTRGAAEAHYDAELAPRLQLPVLWPLLVAAPLPVRPDAFASIVELDMRRHGTACFDLKVSSRAANRLQARLQQVAAEAETANSLRQDLIQRQEAAEQAEQAMRERIAAMFAVEAELQAEIASRTKAEAELQQQLDAAQEICAAVQLQAAEAERRNAALQMAADEAAQREEELRQVKAREAARLRRLGEPPEPTGAALQAELAFLRGREAWLAAEEARLHEAIQQRNHALAATERALLAEQQLVRSMAASVSWHLTAPLRLVGRPLRRLRGLSLRAWRLLRMIITLQLGRKLQERRSLQAHIQDLEASPLFDSAFYQREHPGVAATRAAAAQHYVLVGAAAGFAPNPMFDGAWYDATYRPEGAGGSTALWHYIKHGAASGHDPHPVFDTAWYVAENPQAGGPGGALAHYLAEGAAAGLAPNRFFDVQGYLYEYGEARESGLDPVQHYLRLGAAKGFDPHAFFDTDWYIATHKSAAASGMNPLAYHLRHGAAAGYDTWPWQNRLASFTIDAPLELPSWDAPEVSIVIPAYGHYFDTLRCLNSIAANSGGRVSFETIVIDDKPAQPIAPLLAGINGLRVECNAENLGFLHSCNRADGLVSGWHIIFLNNDTIVCRDWLEPLVEIARTDPRTGMIGCKLLNMDGTVQEAGGIIYDDGWGYPFGQGDISTKPEYNYVRHVDVVTGAAFLIRRDLFRALSGFDVRYAPAFYEEFDLALQVRQAGYEVVYQPRSEVIHLGSSSYGPETRDRQSLRNHAQFCLKWENVLDRQPKREAYLFEARQRPGHIGTILMIDDKLPEYDRHAGALTVFQYILLLRQLGFRLVFAPADGLAREPYGTRLQDLGVEVLYGPAQPESWLRENGARLLAVWIARPDVTAPRLDMLRRYTEALILYYPHDLHYLREMRRYELTGDLGALAESHRVKRLEKRIFETVDCVMTPSAEEAPVISRLVPGTKTRVIPPYLYPAGSATSRDAAHFSGCDTILFVGGFNHPPNVDAVLWLVRDIMPIVWQTRLAAHVLIVGSDPTAEIAALASDKVEVTGHVAELDPYFARARLTVAPLRYGAGVKGKVVSSLQAGVPVVTTAIGNEGIALRDGTEVLLGETAEALAAQILRLLADAAFCAALSQAGADLVGSRFSERRARDALFDILAADKCYVCGNFSVGRSNFEHDQTAHWSERFACEACYALNRTEAVAQLVISTIRRPDVGDLRAAIPYLSPLRIHEFSVTGPIVEELRACPLFTCSEFIDDVAPGRLSAEDIPCQDLQRLTFRDGEFDLLISQDVFEHVPDARAGFMEVFRILKPGGRHVFTVPFSTSRAETIQRAKLTPEGIHHILPPQYHGDPFRKDGALAFWEYGRELVGLLESIGFTVKLHEFGDRALPGNSVTVFDTSRPL